MKFRYIMNEHRKEVFCMRLRGSLGQEPFVHLPAIPQFSVTQPRLCSSRVVSELTGFHIIRLICGLGNPRTTQAAWRGSWEYVCLISSVAESIANWRWMKNTLPCSTEQNFPWSPAHSPVSITPVFVWFLPSSAWIASLYLYLITPAL